MGNTPVANIPPIIIQQAEYSDSKVDSGSTDSYSEANYENE